MEASIPIKILFVFNVFFGVLSKWTLFDLLLDVIFVYALTCNEPGQVFPDVAGAFSGSTIAFL